MIKPKFKIGNIIKSSLLNFEINYEIVSIETLVSIRVYVLKDLITNNNQAVKVEDIDKEYILNLKYILKKTIKTDMLLSSY
jgi:hypothetical protein